MSRREETRRWSETPASVPAMAGSPTSAASRQATWSSAANAITPNAAVKPIAASEVAVASLASSADEHDQERHDDEPAADAEEPAEEPAGDADPGENGNGRMRAGHALILGCEPVSIRRPAGRNRPLRRASVTDTRAFPR